VQLQKTFSLASAIAVGLWCGIAARADDLWITTEAIDGSMVAVVNYGHPNERETPDPHRLVELTAFGASELSLSEQVSRAERDSIGVLVTTPVPIPAEPVLIGARYDNGVWSRVGDKWFNADRRMIPAASESDWSTKFAKALSSATSRKGEAFRRILGHPLELVPQTDPLVLKPGDTLSVLVLFNGKPLVGGMVENSDGQTFLPESAIPRYKSGPDGVAQVPITRKGLQLLAIDYTVKEERASHAPASLYNATFAFVLP
jgi:uncharacterized GH25 family protein